MPFTKSDILEQLDRQERSYRLAILCSLWLRSGDGYKPSAAETARSLVVEGFPYSDLANMLEQQDRCLAIASDFVLNQLHALIRVPFELLSEYCRGYDEKNPGRGLFKDLKETPWYEFARLIRNTISHNFHFKFNDRDKQLMPILWNGITLTEGMHGQRMEYELWHKKGYELFREMRTFAETLPG